MGVENTTQDQIEQLRKQTQGQMVAIEREYAGLRENKKDTNFTAAGYQKLLEELETLRKENIKKDKDNEELLPPPYVQTPEEEVNRRYITEAIEQAALARWFVLNQSLAIAKEIMQPGYVRKAGSLFDIREGVARKQDLVRNDIALLTKSVSLAQIMVKNPTELKERELMQITAEITQGVKSHEKYRSSKASLLWGNLLICLGFLIVFMTGIAPILTATGIGAPAAVGISLGCFLGGVALITLGEKYNFTQNKKSARHEPRVTNSLSTSLHGLHQKQKTLLEKQKPTDQAGVEKVDHGAAPPTPKK